jgi:molecular chaperone DnaJ
LQVKIPAGVDTGDRIRLSGEGEAGRNGGPAGDLYVEVAVRKHAIFEREAPICRAKCPLRSRRRPWEGRWKYPTLEGSAKIKVPAETQSGRMFRLRDQGVRPVRGGSRGDLYCRVVIENSGQPLQRSRRTCCASSRLPSRGMPSRAVIAREPSWLDGVKSFFGSK